LAVTGLAAILLAVGWIEVRRDPRRDGEPVVTASAVELPRLPPRLRTNGGGTSGAPIVLRSGARAVVPAGRSAQHAALVHAERGLPIEHVRSELAGAGADPVGPWDFLLASDESDHASELGELAALVGPRSRSVRVFFGS